MRQVFVILLMLTVVVAEQLLTNSDNTEDKDLARKKRFKFPFNGLWYGFGFHALAILYWIKVKVIIVAFIIGTAIVWGVRYIWAQKSCPEIVHDSPIIPFDHGSSWSPHDHIDHIPYSHSDAFHGHDPYSGYSSYADHPPDIIESHPSHIHRKESRGRQAYITEEQISDIFFAILGINSNACRKRFLCELEFKSQPHPLTRMAFRIIGRGFFRKYVRKPGDSVIPKSFAECGTVHHECTVIEENINETEVENNQDEDWEEFDTQTSTIPPPTTTTTSTKLIRLKKRIATRRITSRSKSL